MKTKTRDNLLRELYSGLKYALAGTLGAAVYSSLMLFNSGNDNPTPLNCDAYKPHAYVVDVEGSKLNPINIVPRKYFDEESGSVVETDLDLVRTTLSLKKINGIERVVASFKDENDNLWRGVYPLKGKNGRQVIFLKFAQEDHPCLGSSGKMDF